MRHRVLYYGSLILMLSSTPVFSAAEFDASTGTISMGSDSTIDGLGPLTICGSIYPYGNGENSAGYIFGKTQTGNTSGLRFFTDDSSGTERLGFGMSSDSDSLPSRTTNSGAYVEGVWSDVCAVKTDGSVNVGTIQIFVNGVEQTYATSTSGSGTLSTDAANTGHIGNRAGNDRTFNGQIDEFYIWNKALTTNDVVALSRSNVKGFGKQLYPQNLVVYHPLDDVGDGQSANGRTFSNRALNVSNGSASGGVKGKATVQSYA